MERVRGTQAPTPTSKEIIIEILEQLIKRMRESKDISGDATFNALVQLHSLLSYAIEFNDAIYDQIETEWSATSEQD